MKSKFWAGLGASLGFFCMSFGAYAQVSTDSLLQQLRTGMPDQSTSSQTPQITNSPTAVLPGNAAGPGNAARPENAPGATVMPQTPTTAPAAPPASPGGDRLEFEEFVSRSLGHDLPAYGRNLFDAPSTFAPVDQVAVPADYVIGPGDEIYVRAWGQIDIDFRSPVDRDGRLYIPKVGSILVSGIAYHDLAPLIRRAVGRIYKSFELDVTLGQLRSIQIFVVGQARRPGTYVVSGLSTIVNGVFASGGPTSKGSMRRIQLKRGDKVVSEFDFYDLLLRGDKSKDTKLLPGDVIFIPPVGPVAAVTGSVNVPGIYELKSNTSLGDFIALAGGLATTASAQKASIQRIVNRQTRLVEEVTLDPAGMGTLLGDGDMVNILTLSPRIANAVTLRGNVAEIQRLPWFRGMRISDVIPGKEALIQPDYWISKNSAGRPNSWLNGGPAPSPDAATLRHDVVRASVEINWDYAVIERLNSDALTPVLIPFNLGKAVIKKDPVHDLQLQPGDIVTVFSVDDIQVPKGRKVQLVRLEGEFATPGVYQIEKGETLRKLVMRVGGLTPNAYVYGSEFTRESTRVTQQQQLDAFLSRLEAEAQRATLQRSQSILSNEDAVALNSQMAAQNRLIQHFRAAKATGRIVLGMKPNDATLKSLPDMPLEDGDRLYIPSLPGTVNVFGAVFNQNAYIYNSKARAGDYLDQAGGPTRDADKSSVYLVRADGSVISTQQKSWFGTINGENIMPGDTVVVPEDFNKIVWTKDLKDWTQIFYQFALGVAGLKVLKDL
jgi:protein involved in polysaccharide export with SLBB domain